MPSSPIVLVQDGAGPFLGTVGGVNVTNGNVISIKLQTPVGPTAWYLEIFGVDEVTVTPPSLAGVNPTTHLVATPGTVVTFTMPAGVGVGRAIVIRSWVDGGGPGLVTTFGLYALTAALARVGAVNEKFEGDPNFGWITKMNPIIRAGGVPTIPTGPATGDLGGVYPNPDVLKIHGTSVPATSGADVGKVLKVQAAGIAIWQAQFAFSAGGDLSGTPTSQVVEKIKNTTITTAGGALTPGDILTVTAPGAADWLPPPTSFTAGGDLSGTPSSQVVEAVKGTAVFTAGGALNPGDVLTATGLATADWLPPVTGFTAGGDLSGTPSSQVVEAVKGTAVTTAGGALNPGDVLTVTGPASADWAAPSGGFIAGGDLSGTNSNQTVEAVKGTTVATAGGALTTGYVLKVTGPSSADWQAEAGGSFTAGGDLSGTPTNQTVEKVNGITYPTTPPFFTKGKVPTLVDDFIAAYQNTPDRNSGSGLRNGRLKGLDQTNFSGTRDVITSTNAPGYTSWKDIRLIEIKESSVSLTPGFNPGVYLAAVDSVNANPTPNLLIFDPVSEEMVHEYALVGAGHNRLCYIGGLNESADHDYLLVAGTGRTDIKQIRLDTGAVVSLSLAAITNITGVRYMLYDGEAVWFIAEVSSGALGGLYKMTNPRSGSPTLTQIYAALNPGAQDFTNISFDGSSIYLSFKNQNSIFKFPVTLSGIGSPTDDFSAGSGTPCNSTAFDGRNLWAAGGTNFSLDFVVRMDPDNGENINTILLPVGSNPSEVIFDGYYIWVTCPGVNNPAIASLYQFDPSSILPGQTVSTQGREISKISGFSNPRMMASGHTVSMGADLFVISESDNKIKGIRSAKNEVVSSLKVRGALVEEPTVITQAAFPTPYKVRAKDKRVHVNTTTTAYQVDLPPFPVLGRRVSVKDKARTAATRNITINGNGNNIEGSATFVINANGTNIDLLYDGTEWGLI